MISKIYLIRHSITIGNLQRLYYGATDLPLAKEGLARIEEYKKKGLYPGIPDDALVFTSGLLRTEQTLELIFGKREHKQIPELKEFNFGEYEMTTYQDLKEAGVYDRWLDKAEGATPLPGGDSQETFARRIIAGTEQVLMEHFAMVDRMAARSLNGASKENPNATVPSTLVVCHGGVISQMMRHILDDQDSNMWGWLPKPACGFDLTPNGREVVEHEYIGEFEPFVPYSGRVDEKGNPIDDKDWQSRHPDYKI